jgi:hypothetical protein
MGHIQPFHDALLSDWQNALERDEWFFSRLEEDIVTRLSPSEAFAALDEVATLLLQQVEPILKYYCGTFLLSLARRSDTTEMPTKLRQIWNSVMDSLREAPSIVEQLSRWYRLS